MPDRQPSAPSARINPTHHCGGHVLRWIQGEVAFSAGPSLLPPQSTASGEGGGDTAECEGSGVGGGLSVGHARGALEHRETAKVPGRVVVGARAESGPAKL